VSMERVSMERAPRAPRATVLALPDLLLPDLLLMARLSIGLAWFVPAGTLQGTRLRSVRSTKVCS